MSEPTSRPTSLTTSRVAVVPALVVVLIASFMDLLDATIVSVAAPAIAADLGSTDAALQWTVAAYTLALGATLVTGGRVGDQLGRRRVFLTGLAGFAVASAACALAPSAGVLVTTRVVQGLAAGMMIPQVFGIIRASFEPAARARALGAYGAVLGLASVAGPLLGGLLVDADLLGLGWRTIFWVNVPIAAVALVVGARVLPESRAPEPQASTSRAPVPQGAARLLGRLDLPGAALAATATVLVLTPLVQGRAWGWPAWGFGLMALAIGVGALFLRREAGLVAADGEPILDPVLLRERAFASGLAASVLFFGAIGPFFLLLSLYLQLGTGRSALATGLVIVPYALGSIVTSGIGVALAARAGRVLLVTGSVVLAASQALLLVVVHADADPSFWSLAVPLLVGGAGLGLAAPILVGVVLAGVPARNAGAASGVLTTASQVGNAVGVALLGVLFFADLEASLTAGSSSLNAYAGAFVAILPWQIGCYLVAAALMMLLPRRAVAPAA